MPFYRLLYTGATKDNFLPKEINKNASDQDLNAFARESGDDSFSWEHVTLVEVTDIKDPIQDIGWSSFKKALKDEPALFDYPWSVFQRRIKHDMMAAIIDPENEAISTVNIVPKFNKDLKIVLSLPADKDPQVYETGAGWADKKYRGVGLYTQLRHNLIEGSSAQGKLIFSEGTGKGAANVNIKNNWSLVNWAEFPFASSLMGWEKEIEGEKKFQLAAGKIIDLPEKGLYLGRTIKTSDGLNTEWLRTQYDWSKHHHLWVNNIGKLRHFEDLLRADLHLTPQSSPDAEKSFLEFWRESVANNLFYDRKLLGEDLAISRAWEEFDQKTHGTKRVGKSLENQIGDHHFGQAS